MLPFRHLLLLVIPFGFSLKPQILVKQLLMTPLVCPERHHQAALSRHSSYIPHNAARLVGSLQSLLHFLDRSQGNCIAGSVTAESQDGPTLASDYPHLLLLRWDPIPGDASMFKSKTTETPKLTNLPIESKPMPMADAKENAAPTYKNYIAAGTIIEGNMILQDDLYLAGTIRGDIQSNSKLIIGADAIVEGNLFAANAEVAGRITGTVECRGLLGIKSTCVIEGDIVTKSLNVEPGSTFNGRCKVGGAAEAAKTTAPVAKTATNMAKPVATPVKTPAATKTETAPVGESVFG